MRRITLLAVGATLLAACGGGSDGGGSGGVAAGGKVFDKAGAPYTVAVPTTLDGLEYAPYDRGDVEGRAVYGVKVSQLDGTGPTAWVYAFPAGETLDDSPEQLGRRVWLESHDAGEDPGTIEQRAFGGRPGFRFRVREGGDELEYRGAAIGEWLVVEVCASNDSTGPTAAACDAIDASLRLRDAPPATAATGGEEQAPAHGGYRVKVPAGFTPASLTLTDELAYIDEADALVLLYGGWQNDISVETFARPADDEPPADSHDYCAELEAQLPPQGHRTTPADTTLGGHPAWGCTITPAADGAAARMLMPDQIVRRTMALVRNSYLEVQCSSTAAQREATDRACDQVLRTIELGG